MSPLRVMEHRPRPVTHSVDLPGGQDRLRQVILYVARACEGAERFGGIKLNKIIWKADFDSFAARHLPVTGRAYRRQNFGPVPKEMPPVHREMLSEGMIRVDRVDFGEDPDDGRPITEHRTVALREPDLRHFSREDLAFVDAAIRYYWSKTGMEASDDSHGLAWKTRANGDPMPYELALISDRRLGHDQRRRIERLMVERGCFSD